MFNLFKKKSKEVSKREPDTFEIHTGWGDHISWLNTEQFRVFDEDTLFSVYGHLPFNFPEPGDLLEGAFDEGIITFKFISVERKSGPIDMFVAKVIYHER